MKRKHVSIHPHSNNLYIYYTVNKLHENKF